MVNVCLTGVVPSKADNPLVPMSPEEIAADCDRCMTLGASIFQIHGHRPGRARRNQESVSARTTRSTSRSDSDGESGRLSVRLPKRSAVGRDPGR